MGWIKRRGYAPHNCEVPDPEPEAVWECDTCHQVWQTEASMTVYDAKTKKRAEMGWWWVKQ